MKKIKILIIINCLGTLLTILLYLFLKSSVQSPLKENIKNFLRRTYNVVKNNKDNLIENIELTAEFNKDKKIENNIKKEYEKLYYDFENPDIKINPYGRNPLSALIKFETDTPVKIKIIVKSDQGDFIKSLNEFKTSHEIGITKLFLEDFNLIEIISEEKDGTIQKRKIELKMNKFELNYPIIISKKLNKLQEFLLLEYGSYGEKGRIPVIIDSQGKIRWVLEIKDYYGNSFFTEDGSFIFGNKNKIYKYNELGKIEKVIKLKGYTLHHDIKQTPNGNYLIAANKNGSILKQKKEIIYTVEDYIIEVDKDGKLIKEWDFKHILDTERKVIANLKEDWLHINSVFYDDEKNEIVVSANFQGIFAVDYNDSLKWIISDSIGYNDKFKNKLLSKDEFDLNFKFPYGQHEATKLENGNILTFDNNAIHFDFDNQLSPKLKKLISENNEYSRVVEYKIDLKNMKVYQEWEYYDTELWSKTISGVKKYGEDYLITYGRLKDKNGNWYGKVRKVNKDKEIEYDFDIIYRDNNGAAIYRSTILK